MSNEPRLRDHAIEIWRAAVAAVDAGRLVRQTVVAVDDGLLIDGEHVTLADDARLLVVGGGKASGAMAAGLVAALSDSPIRIRTSGWVNVPDDVARPLEGIHLHPARPRGRNEPTEAGVQGTERILALIAGLRSQDVCIIMLSGGGSALLPAPEVGVTLEDKQWVARAMAEAGAGIEELNVVRTALSRVKGGGLARAAGVSRLYSLVLSDVIGDRLDLIASGPTYSTAPTIDAPAALEILRAYVRNEEIPARVRTFLEARAHHAEPRAPLPASVRHVVIGSNATALDAAAREAQRRGYRIASCEADVRGEARRVGQTLGERCLDVRRSKEPADAVCLLSGGEPVVRLAPSDRDRSGGRNQELVLGAVSHLWTDGMRDIVVLSGGTDGEDGPTDAAGAFADGEIVQKAKDRGLDPNAYLAFNDAYHFFAPIDALLKTGATNTNVMDVRVALVARSHGA